MIKKLSVKILSVTAAIFVALGLFFLVFAGGSNKAYAAGNTDTAVTKLAWQTNNMLTFTLSANDYQGVEGNSNVGKRYGEYNFAEKVLFYTDYYGKTAPRALKDCIRGDNGEYQEIYYNMWGLSGSLSVSLFAEEFSVGDKAVKRVEIPAGTEFPAFNYTGAAPFGTGNYSEPQSTEKTSFATTEKIVFIINSAGEFVPESEWEEPEEFNGYKSGVKYDANAEFFIKQESAPTGYDAKFNFIPFNEFTDFATSYMGDSGKSLTAGTNMAKGSYLELDFVQEIDSSEFYKLTIGFAGHNTGGSKELTFEAYNAYDLQKNSSAKPVQSFSVSFWKVGTTSFTLADYADENGKVDKIVFRLTSDYTEQQLFVTDFLVVKEVPLVEIEGSVPEKLHIRGWLNDPVTGDPLPLENRNDAHCKLIFFLSEDVCDETEYVEDGGNLYKKSIAADLDRIYEYNTLDYVLLTIVISEDTASYNGTDNGDGTKTITLREAFEWNGWTDGYNGKEVFYTVFGESGNAIGYGIGNLLGTDVVKVTVLKGCQFPYYEYTNNTSATEKKALVQTETMDFTDTAPSKTFAIGWKPQINKGETEITEAVYNASGNDNVLTFKLTESDYENAPQDSASGLEKAFANDECYKNIIVNGKKLYWYFENYDETINSVINIDGETGTFSLNIPGLTANDKVISVIIKSGCRFPAYANTRASIKAYGVCYYETKTAVAFELNETTGKLEKTAVKWKVTFDGENEIYVEDGKTIEEGSFPQPPQKSGEIFLGWYEGDNKWRSENTVKEDVNLVSVYDKTVTVTFESNGGSRVEAQTIVFGGWIKYPANPEKNGKTFLGWYKDKSCTEEFDRYEEVTENITLYAKWSGESNGGCGGGITADCAEIFALAITGAVLCLWLKKKTNKK